MISKNINWLKNKNEFLKLYNEIIKNGDLLKLLIKKLFHQRFLKFL